MSIDTIANLITIIKNGYAAAKTRVYLPFSKEKENILEVLKKDNYIKDLRATEKDGKKLLVVKLLYKNDMPAINEIKRVSKPGQRIYSKPDKFKPVLIFSKSRHDLGTTVISTSQGIMSTREARKKRIGGEVILKVY